MCADSVTQLQKKHHPTPADVLPNDSEEMVVVRLSHRKNTLLAERGVFGKQLNLTRLACFAQ